MYLLKGSDASLKNNRSVKAIEGNTGKGIGILTRVQVPFRCGDCRRKPKFFRKALLTPTIRPVAAIGIGEVANWSLGQILQVLPVVRHLRSRGGGGQRRERSVRGRMAT